jgi:hypothetical protein
MPNWCNNTVELYHDDPEMIERARKAFNDSKFLNEFVPIPESLQIVSGRCGADDNPEQIALEAAQKNNIDVHGYKDWYDFSVNEWGTKWDVGDSDGINDIQPNELTVFFESAWAPPLAAYEKMTEMGFEIEAMYDESGMGFCGRWTNEGGDDYYEYSGMTSETVENELPKELNEAFGIAENIAYYEQEEENE